MKTIWSESTPKIVTNPYYPRPQLRRDSFCSLNGLWDFYMGPDKLAEEYTERILVPFSPESELSGINRKKHPGDYLHYRRFFELPAGFLKSRLILHFGAVDLYAEVLLNGILVGSHRGGYWPFSLDITEAYRPGRNVLEVIVTDEGASAFEDAYGKQSEKPGGILYPAQSGIWQTVWLESVPDVYITELKLTPLYEREELLLLVSANRLCACKVTVDGAEYMAASDRPVHVPLPHMRPWSPEDPYLYSVKIETSEDCVFSYFAMRKFSLGRDAAGTPRLFLNEKPYFCTGVLDQGYWSDGLYTAPSEEAMICDIQTVKALGFNTLRKHAKIEPLYWYYLCDSMGMLVWQDMVNGGGPYPFLLTKLPVFLSLKHKDNAYKLFGRKTAQSRRTYKTEAADTVSLLYNSPSVVLWTAFNEGWGQFDALGAEKRIRKLDPTRLIDHASGWYDQGGGDINSRHIYFKPIYFLGKKDSRRALCLTEFGGYALKAAGRKHTFSYGRYSSEKKLSEAMERLYGRVITAAKQSGLSAAIYTQLSDVEQEENGLITYDRRKLKIVPETIQKINRELTGLYDPPSE